MEINLKQILEGWRNSIIPPDDIKDLVKTVSEERLSVCKNCPFNSTNAKVFGQYRTLRLDEHCIACGCVLSAKTKCLSCKCPKDKWLSVATEEERYEIDKIINNENNELQTGNNQGFEGSDEGLSNTTNVNTSFDSTI